MSKVSRNSFGHRAFRRSAKALRNRVAHEGLPCAWCGKPIDLTLPPTDPMSFTADHPQAIAAGGRLAGQQLQPMHRRCNSAKGDAQPVEIWEAS